jgi:hypothetical protein
MLAGVILGFSRTYYLRSLFGAQDMLGGAGLPTHLHVHGFVMSVWFAFVVGQTLLIQQNHVMAHRRAGLAGLAIAAAVIIAGLYTVWSFVPRAALANFDPATAKGIAVGDTLAMLVFFPLVVGAAVLYRRRPETHKRLMMASCILLWPPVLSRYVATLAANGWSLMPVLAATELTWLAALVAYDLWTRKRVHLATIGACVVVVFARVSVALVVNTDSASDFFEWLSR